ncbi:MAG: efflux RND transporter periplasmic adaptor subunit [Lentisphaeria bacterium]|nr:efflux RND transporter periplasmic adaptor subunit [Lentisphaeria bacterium]
MKISSVFAAVGGVVLAVAVSSCREVEKKTPPPPSVVVEEAAEFDFADSCTEVGTVAAFDSVDLVANVSGFLTEVNFKEGALVKKGEKLFQIDPAVYDAAVKKATADLRKAQADLKNAEIEYDRQKQLLRKDATAKRNYDLAEMNKMTAAADVLAAEAGLEQAKVNLSYTRVLAPFDGWISFKKYSAGNMVGPTSGVLATVVRNGDVKIYFSIIEMDMLRLLRSYPGADRNADKKGPEVEIDFQDGVKYEYPGRISAWNNAISDGTGTFRLQAVAKNPDRKLFPGMYVRVKIRVEPYSRQIMIRNEAIMREQLGNFVFVVNKDNKIERRKVTLGGKNGGYYAVREGLKKGERIVIAGLQKAQPGSIVTPIANKEQAPDGSATPVANAK